MSNSIEMTDFITHPADVFLSHFDTILERNGKPPQLPIRFLPALNSKIWGLQKKTLTIVGGRPSQGKSTLLLNLAYDFAQQGKVVYFFSFEMSKEVCVERLFCSACNTDNWLVRTGEIGRYDLPNSKFNEIRNKFYESLGKQRFVLIESIGRELPELEKLMNMFEMKPDVVFIDYGNMIKEKPRVTRKEVLDEYIRGLRALAIRNDFSAIMGAQINRKTHEGNKIREPQLWELKDSGELEQVADMVFLLHWPYYYDKTNEEGKNTYILNVAKNREGRTGKIECLFFPQFYKISEEVPTITFGNKRMGGQCLKNI
uniref:Putative helicase n=1 Tax=viral metagenome TaxID=1070528 RepID=A0A6H1ZC19_9ZZZZ